MKNIVFAALAAVSILCSCSKKSTNECPLDGVSVKISFTDAQLQSRAIPSTAQPWEKSLSSVAVLVCNNSGNLIVQRNFTSTEIASRSATLSLTGVNSGERCDFYVVANFGALPPVATQSALLDLLESGAALYNGTFAEVSTTAKRAGGFVMSGSASRNVIAGGITDVSVTLKRTVAKMSVQTMLGAGFGSSYSGSLKVKSISISGAASQTPVFASAPTSTGTMNFSVSQQPGVSNEVHQSLFYIYENGSLSSGDRVKLTIDALYDMDGDLATTADQRPVTYTAELTGEGKGDFIRNGYYQVSVSLEGLTGSDTSVNITVADWESPVTQSVELGS